MEYPWFDRSLYSMYIDIESIYSEKSKRKVNLTFQVLFIHSRGTQDRAIASNVFDMQSKCYSIPLDYSTPFVKHNPQGTVSERFPVDKLPLRDILSTETLPCMVRMASSDNNSLYWGRDKKSSVELNIMDIQELHTEKFLCCNSILHGELASQHHLNSEGCICI